jgi:hypothetical protein
MPWPENAKRVEEAPWDKPDRHIRTSERFRTHFRIGRAAVDALAIASNGDILMGGNGVTIVVAYPFAILMFANGLGHIAAALVRRRFISGVYWSPVLLLASRCLLICAQGARRVF